MVDQCPFLLEALTRVDNNKFPFYPRFKVACDLLLSLAHACPPPFEQFIMHQMIHFQHSILKRLHHHTFFSMLFDKISKAHYARILSCSCLGANTWFTTWVVFLAFWLFSPIFSMALHMRLGLPHPSIASVCTHTINFMGIHFLCYIMAMNALEPMMQFVTPLP
jgi:hypothetical protein